MRRLAREPLTLFLVLGGVLYGLDLAASVGATDADLESPPPIVVPAARVAALNAEAGGRVDLEAGIAAFAEEEAMLHEARRLGLDTSDLIVRRRLLQKMAFVVEDRVSVPEPDDTDLRAFLDRHAARYAEPPRTTVSHRFFSRARRGARAEADARAAITTPTATGDDFMAGARFVDATPADLARRFGDDAAATLATLPVSPDTWQGPVSSAFGWHTVRITARTSAGSPAFEAVRPRLRADWMANRREAAVAEVRRALAARHRIIVESPAPDARAARQP